MCCFSPCGNLVFAGGDDGNVCVWNADTGASVAILEPYRDRGTRILSVHCVCYHLVDHLLAVGQYGNGRPVLVIAYEGVVVGVKGDGKQVADGGGWHLAKRKLKKTSGGGGRNVDDLHVIIDKIDKIFATA